jgi:hypothetical protein
MLDVVDVNNCKTNNKQLTLLQINTAHPLKLHIMHHPSPPPPVLAKVDHLKQTTGTLTTQQSIV